MTFSEFVLESRKRLHDYRNSNMEVITDASKDGIRFTSEQLQSICKGALQEMLRTFRALKLDNYIHTEVQHQFMDCEIASGSGVLNNITDGFQKIKRIQADDISVIYDYIEPEEFFSKKWRTAILDVVTPSSGSCTVKEIQAIGEAWFTVTWDAANKKPIINTLPLPSAKIENCKAVVVYPLNAFFTLASTTDLPFIDIDDIMLDYAEKQARQIDHNNQQVDLVMKTIQNKLGELSLELQKRNR